MRRTSEKTKVLEKRGTSVLADYKPWIEVAEFGSVGTATIIIDWKTGRPVHLMSQGEAAIWYELRYDPNNIDIREQYPLNKEETMKIADRLGYKHPADPKTGKLTTMTTDFLVTRSDSSKIAITVKTDFETLLNNSRTKEKFEIEKAYWEQRQIPLQFRPKSSVNKQYANNIRFVSVFYNLEDSYIPDDITILKHLIARREIDVDLRIPLNLPALVQQHMEEIYIWKKTHLE